MNTRKDKGLGKAELSSALSHMMFSQDSSTCTGALYDAELRGKKYYVTIVQHQMCCRRKALHAPGASTIQLCTHPV